jgi:hypothetical protein
MDAGHQVRGDGKENEGPAMITHVRVLVALSSASYGYGWAEEGLRETLVVLDEGWARELEGGREYSLDGERACMCAGSSVLRFFW